MELVGHRGLINKDVSENTLDSIKLAIKSDLPFIEMDLRKTKDGQIILHHDPDFIINDNGYCVNQLTLAELRKLKKIATLDEVLKISKGKKLILDIKDKNIEQDIYNIIKKNKAQNRVIIDSIDPEVHKKFLMLDPKILREIRFIDTKLQGILWWPFYRFFFIRKAKKVYANYICLVPFYATKRFIKKCHRNCLKVSIYYIKNNKEIEKMINNDADALVLDTVDQIEFTKSILKD